MRALAIELIVIRDYARRLMLTAAIVALAVGLALRNVIAVPGIVTMIYVVSVTSALFSYDEREAWGRSRLTLPVTRGEVVGARCAAIALCGLFGMGVGLVLSCAIAAVAGGLPGARDFTSMTLTGETVAAMLFSACMCLIAGAAMAAVDVPVLFRFGYTKATAYVPIASTLVLVAVAAATGIVGRRAFRAFSGVVLASNPMVIAAVALASVALAAALLAVAGVIAYRWYRKREA